MGAPDAQGVYVYDETDPASPFSTLLNKLGASISAVLAKLTSHPRGRWVLGGPTQALSSGTFSLLNIATAATGEVDTSKFTNASGSITVNEDGWYDVHASCIFASSASGRRGLFVVRNGTFSGSSVTAGGSIIGADVRGAVSGGETAMPVRARPVFLNVGDVIRVYAFQDSGGALNAVLGSPTLYYGETGVTLRKVTP